MEEIRDILKYLNEIGILVLLYLLSFICMVPLGERNVVCGKIILHYLKFNQVTDSIPFVSPDVASLLEQIHVASSNCYAAIHLGNAFFSRPISKQDQNPCAFMWEGQQCCINSLSLGCTSAPSGHC